jgi:hypothetical protein
VKSEVPRIRIEIPSLSEIVSPMDTDKRNFKCETCKKGFNDNTMRKTMNKKHAMEFITLSKIFGHIKKL